MQFKIGKEEMEVRLQALGYFINNEMIGNDFVTIASGKAGMRWEILGGLYPHCRVLPLRGRKYPLPD